MNSMPRTVTRQRRGYDLNPGPTAPESSTLIWSSGRHTTKKRKGSRYSITERRVLELIPVLGSQPAGDVRHKPGGRLPLLFARPTVTLTTL